MSAVRQTTLSEARAQIALFFNEVALYKNRRKLLSSMGVEFGQAIADELGVPAQEVACISGDYILGSHSLKAYTEIVNEFRNDDS